MQLIEHLCGYLFSVSIAFLFPDQELKNIIDKLAQFVARNGPEFEQMTKSKQKDNPKFSFLFGGDYFNYYQYKVTTEQASKLTSNMFIGNDDLLVANSQDIGLCIISYTFQ